MVISLASFYLTPTNFGVIPVQNINPITDVCFFVATRTTTQPATPYVLCDPNGVYNLCDLLAHQRGQLVKYLRRRLRRGLRFLVLYIV